MDDDELSREVFALLLAEDGFEVEVAISGDAAAAAFLDGLRVDVVLADWKMPGLSGPALATELRRVSPAGTRLLAMSAAPVDPGATGKFEAVLHKPFSMKEFRAMLSPKQGVGTEAAPVAETTPVAAAESLDETVYLQLMSAMPAGKADMLYDLCLADAATRLETMRRAALAQDEAAFRAGAHAVRGGAGMVGALEMAALARRMEDGGLESSRLLAEMIPARARLERILTARKEARTLAANGKGRPA